MHSQCVIISIFDKFHPMTTLKQNQVFRSQNLLDVSPPKIILLTKHVSFWVGEFSGSHCRLCTPSYTFTGFHHWTHMYNQKYRSFHPMGYLSLLATTRHKFLCSTDSGTSLNFIQRIEPTHQPPRMVCDGTISYSASSGTPLNDVQCIDPTNQPPRMVCDGTMHLHP